MNDYWPGLERVGLERPICCPPVLGAEVTKPPPDNKHKWLIRGGAALAIYWLLKGEQVRAVVALGAVAYLVKKDVLPEAPPGMMDKISQLAAKINLTPENVLRAVKILVEKGLSWESALASVAALFGVKL